MSGTKGDTPVAGESTPIQDDSSKSQTTLLSEWVQPSSKTPEGRRRLAIVMAHMISSSEKHCKSGITLLLKASYVKSQKDPVLAEALDNMILRRFTRAQLNKMFAAGLSIGVRQSPSRPPSTKSGTIFTLPKDDELHISIHRLWTMIEELEAKLHNLIKAPLAKDSLPTDFANDTPPSTSNKGKKKKNRKKKPNRAQKPQEGGPTPQQSRDEGRQKPVLDIEPSLAGNPIKNLDIIIEERKALLKDLRATLGDHK